MSGETCTMHDCERPATERYAYPYPLPEPEAEGEHGYCAEHAALMRKLAAESKRAREAANAAGHRMQV